MKVKVFKSYKDFQRRKNTDINGVSAEFAERHPESLRDLGNVGCWNCTYCAICFKCRDCISCVHCTLCNRCVKCDTCTCCQGCCSCCNCIECREIPAMSLYACFTGVYRYVCSPRIHMDGSQHIQMGCFIRTRAEWEANPWNNQREFPNDGSLLSELRQQALKMAFQWLDEKMKLQKECAL
jgi:hypothetical protein